MKDSYSNQKNTYLPYTRGILPDELRLGSLYLDPYNPNLGLEKFRFEYREKTLSEEKYWESIQAWTGEPEVDDIEPYILRFQATADWAAQAKIIDTAHLGVDKTKTTDVSIVGTHARRYQIKKPEKFLSQQVLTQPEVKKWIVDRLSISFYARWKHHQKTGEPWKAPSIWLVTGVHLISNAAVHSGWNVGLNVHGGASIDPGTLATGTPTGKSAEVQSSMSKNMQIENLYGQSGERVWCAQFMELAVDFTNGPRRNEPQGWFTRPFHTKEIEVLQLRQVEDLGVSGVRRRTTMKGSRPSSIDWKKHQAMIVGLQTTGEDTYEAPAATHDDTTATAIDGPDNDEPLGAMVVADLPYNQGLSARDWETSEDYLAYLEYQD